MAPQDSGFPAGDPLSRRAELAGRLDTVRSRIGAACAAAGRNEGELTLIAVTKTYPASDVLLLAGLGLCDFGENRDQEAGPKAAEVAAGGGTGVRWHFIGQLQTNKARSVARYADAVHSVDRIRLVRALGAAALAAGRELTCLVQVSLDPADADAPDGQERGGVPSSRTVSLPCARGSRPRARPRAGGSASSPSSR